MRDFADANETGASRRGSDPDGVRAVDPGHQRRNPVTPVSQTVDTL